MTLGAPPVPQGRQFRVDASAARLADAAWAAPDAELALAHDIVVTATVRATIYSASRTDPGATGQAVLDRFDLAVAPAGLAIVPFREDDGEVRPCSVHQGPAAVVALAELVKLTSVDAVTADEAMPSRSFEGANAFMTWFVEGGELRSVDARALTVLVESNGQPWWYLVRLVDGGTTWGLAAFGEPVELLAGNFATFWSRLASIVATAVAGS